MASICFAYYCSGHGYGHATRVSALACHLLKSKDNDVQIHIVSSAPQHVFADSIALGALYRYAHIDPVIIQPLAYHVDRQRSVNALKEFLRSKQDKLEVERQWLIDIKAHCVLSDAAFLGCLAAKAACLPSILITNFTFDSVYSFLSAPIADNPTASRQLYPDIDDTGIFGQLVSDSPVSASILHPLVAEMHAGYRCADLLLLLPGSIPIPSFWISPTLEAQNWIDPQTQRFRPEIVLHLASSSLPCPDQLHPPLPFPMISVSNLNSRRCLGRAVVRAPLLVRLPTTESSVYTPAGRSEFLSSIGIPSEYHDPHKTRILVVSFGGQVIRRPPSRPASRSGNKSPFGGAINNIEVTEGLPITPLALQSGHTTNHERFDPVDDLSASAASNTYHFTSPRLATSSHLWFPGAPPVMKTPSMPSSPQLNGHPKFAMTLSTPTPVLDQGDKMFPSTVEEDDGPFLLPDSSWIAVVCGVSREEWNELDSDLDLPSGFFIAPRYVYMPDLMAVADVLLGKLGYGTVSECIDSRSPFVYVSRPLFIEEYGLRLLLDHEGVGVELSRQSYEEGDWAGAIEEAWAKGKDAKWRKRKEGALGVGIRQREADGVQLAGEIVSWVKGWWSGQPEGLPVW